MSILLYILHLEPKPKYFTLTQIEINSVCVWNNKAWTMDSHSKAHLNVFSHEHTKLFLLFEAENSQFTSMSIRENIQRHCEYLCKCIFFD